jgi:hypothetical protein
MLTSSTTCLFIQAQQGPRQHLLSKHQADAGPTHLPVALACQDEDHSAELGDATIFCAVDLNQMLRDNGILLGTARMCQNRAVYRGGYENFLHFELASLNAS